MTEIKLPELKENVDTVEVNAVLVKPGDFVSQGQLLVEVQADKAALDVPSPVAGKVAEVRVEAGQQVKVGEVVCTIEAGADKPAEKPATKPPAAHAAGSPEPSHAAGSPEPSRTAGSPKAEPKVEPTRTAVETVPAARPADGEVVLAGPATRRLARELGVDLKFVKGTGRNNRVTEDDVKTYVRQLAGGNMPEPAPAMSPGAYAPGSPAAPPLPRFEDFGPVQREALTKVRVATARQMSLAWGLIPHVTQHDEADITDLESFRKSRDGKGPKLTVTAFALKACAVALKQFPAFNASLDLGNNQLVLKQYYHIGVAVDTERGLVVPVIRDVDRKSVEQLAAELTETAEKARKGSFDMRGGTFTISNLGGIGGTGFTPIVNWPEVAILGLSRGRLTPSWRDGRAVPRLMLPLSLSYDHRVIDGAAAARFTRFVAEMLENPWMMAVKS